MKQTIGYVTVVVADYDEAIKFYVDTLGFSLIEDTFIEAQICVPYQKPLAWRRFSVG